MRRDMRCPAQRSAPCGTERRRRRATAFADASSGEPVTLETRFAIGSLAKSMVATAVARLASEGRLELEDPVAAHVPELHGSDWARRATVRDLMANRSRLPLQARLEFGDFEGDDADVLSRFVAEVARGEPTASFWSYTNAGWSLLGRAMETVTGPTWEDAIRATLFAPLGMDQTTFATWPAAEPRAAGHQITSDGPVPVDRWTLRAFGPAGTTLLSTVGDLLRFATAQLEDPSLAVLRVVHAEIRIHSWQRSSRCPLSDGVGAPARVGRATRRECGARGDGGTSKIVDSTGPVGGANGCGRPVAPVGKRR
jgi:CubicO group peptidase (beta-lactamase class C family)